MPLTLLVGSLSEHSSSSMKCSLLGHDTRVGAPAVVAVDDHHPILGPPVPGPLGPGPIAPVGPVAAVGHVGPVAPIPPIAPVGVGDYGAPPVAPVLSPLDAFAAMIHP